MYLELRSKVTAAVISLAMVFTMVPLMAQTAYADDSEPAAICLVNDMAPNITGAQTSSIWFGNYKQSDDGSGDHNKEPIKWRVLDNIVDENGHSISQLLLLSDQNLDCKKYNDTVTSVTWKTSGIRTWLNGEFVNTAFSSDEQSAIKTTEVVNDNNPDHDTPGGVSTIDQIFLLSIAEATNENYGFTTDYISTSTREALNTQYAMQHGAWTSNAGNGNWWLRSPGSQQDHAACVNNVGSVDGEGYDVESRDIAVRPAFKFNLSSAILTSAVEGGKGLGTEGADSLKEVGTNTTGEWQVTLKSGHDSFAVDSVTTCDGKTLNITYSGAVKGAREYISAIIKDKDGKVKYYGNLKKCAEDTDVSGTVKINVDGKLGADDTLCVFNEQLNGIKYTDFASELIQLTVPEAEHKYEYEYVNDEYHKGICTACGKETMERHTYSDGGRCDVCNGLCKHSSLSDSYAHNSEWHWKECKYCAVKIDEQEHKWREEWTSDEAQHWHECEVCQRKKDEEEHTWDDGKVTKPATCAEKGVKTFTCTVEGCEATKTEEIKAKGHKEIIDKAVPATCTETGLTEGKHCSVCNEVLVKQETVPATGHKWDAGKVTKAATEKAEGIKTYTCTVCKATRTEPIPKLKPSAPKVSGKLLPKMTAKKKSVTISWSKIKGVAGYDIFFARCNHDKKNIIPKKVKTIKGNKTFKWTKSKLKKGTAYKAYVKAYVMKKGKKSYVRTSPLIHAYTGNGTKRYTNAKSVSANKSKVTLKKGKTFKIKAKVNKIKKNKKLMPKGHAAKLRYMTSNKKIATVSKSGKIKAKTKGTCYIYAYAHNGVSKQVKITVK